MMKKFRTLRADEIDCRVSTVSQKGVSLLLYKDARCDMNILDETVGPENWQRRHSRDNANCIVAIWDGEKMQWIEKEDTGTESYTEKEKGLASDSFKRACVNWGIGRELYTAPFIWIPAESCNIAEAGTDNRGKVKYTCRDRFTVADIGYDENRSINRLAIRCKNRILHILGGQHGTPAAEEPVKDAKQQQVPQNLVQTAHVNSIAAELARTGIGLKGVLKTYHLRDIHDMTIDQYRAAMDILNQKPDKPAEASTPDPSSAPSSAPPDPLEDAGLPWNQPV